jgi:ribulose-5-phosphate 4-epimerase/fuculose-1-phosphate aldolase
MAIRGTDSVCDTSLLPATFFVSNRIHQSAIGEELIATGKRLADNMVSCSGGSISARYLNRFIVTSEGVDLGSLRPANIIEIADYDPARNSILAIGTELPTADTPIHWFAYRGFPEVNAVIHVHDEQVLNASDPLGLPITSHKAIYITPEIAMEVLETLKGHRYAVLREHGTICIGENLDTTCKRVLEMREMARMRARKTTE